jgi:hydroxymethylbilane synthase
MSFSWRVMSLSDDRPALRIGSRDSRLAVIQAESVLSRLAQAHPHLALTHHTQKTLGDRFLQAPISALGTGGQFGVFVKELEEALLAGLVDVAVHSLKDMSSRIPDGLTVVPIGPREDVRDAWLCPAGLTFAQLPPGARVGTSALRRVAQLRRWRPDVVFVPIRGNLQTRWQKLLAGDVDGLVLAAAGCHRLAEADPQWRARITGYFNPVVEMIPAVGQGVLALEYRTDDLETAALLAPLADGQLAQTIAIERTIMATLEGGCQLPLGVLVEPLTDGGFKVWVRLLLPDGSQAIDRQVVFSGSDHLEAQSVALAHELLANGGQSILDALKRNC